MAQQYQLQHDDRRVRIKEIASSLLEVQMQPEALDILRHVPAATQDRFNCLCLLRFVGAPQGPPSTSHWTPEALVYWNDLEASSPNRMWNTSQRWLGFCCQGCRRASLQETNGPTITPYTVWVEVPSNPKLIAPFKKNVMTALWHCIGHVNSCFLRHPPLAAEYPIQDNKHLDAFLLLYAKALVSTFHQNSIPMSLQSQRARQQYIVQQRQQQQQQQQQLAQLERERLLRLQQQQAGLYRENMQSQEEMRQQIIQQARMQELQQQELRRQTLQAIQQRHSQQQLQRQKQQSPQGVPNTSTGGRPIKRKYTNFIATSSEKEDLFTGLQPHLDAVSDRSRPTRTSIFHRFPQLCGPSVCGRISFPLLLVLQHYALQVQMHPPCIHYSLVCVHCNEKFHFRNSLAPDKGVHHALVQMSQDFVVNHLTSCGHTPAWVVKTFQRKLDSFSAANWSSFLKRIHKDSYSLMKEEQSKASAACEKVTSQRHPWEMDCFRMAVQNEASLGLDLPNWVQKMDPEVDAACPLISENEASFVIFGNELYREAPGNQRFRALMLKVRHEYLQLPTPEEREVAASELLEHILSSGSGSSKMSMVRWTADEDPKFVPLPEEESMRIIRQALERGFPEVLRSTINPAKESRVVEVETVPMFGVVNDVVRWDSESNGSERILLRQSHVVESRSEWSKIANPTPRDIAKAVEDMFGESCPLERTRQQSFDYEEVEEPPPKKARVDQESPPAAAPAPPPPQKQNNNAVIDLSLDDDDEGKEEQTNAMEEDIPNDSASAQQVRPRDHAGSNGRGKDLRLVQAQTLCNNSTSEIAGNKEREGEGAAPNKEIPEVLGNGLGKNMASLRAIIAAEGTQRNDDKTPTDTQEKQSEKTPKEVIGTQRDGDRTPAQARTEQTQNTPRDVHGAQRDDGNPSPELQTEQTQNTPIELDGAQRDDSKPSAELQAEQAQNTTIDVDGVQRDDDKTTAETAVEQSESTPMEVDGVQRENGKPSAEAHTEQTQNTPTEVDGMHSDDKSPAEPPAKQSESTPMEVDGGQRGDGKPPMEPQTEQTQHTRTQVVTAGVSKVTTDDGDVSERTPTRNGVDSTEQESQGHPPSEPKEVEVNAKRPSAAEGTNQSGPKGGTEVHQTSKNTAHPDPPGEKEVQQENAVPTKDAGEKEVQQENEVQFEDTMVTEALSPELPSTDQVMVDVTNQSGSAEPSTNHGVASKNGQTNVEEEEDSSDDEPFISPKIMATTAWTVSQEPVNEDDSDTETDDSIGTGARRVIQTAGEDARGPAHRLMTLISRKKNRDSGKDKTKSKPTPKAKASTAVVPPSTTATTVVGSQNDPVELLESSSEEEVLLNI